MPTPPFASFTRVFVTPLHQAQRNQNVEIFEYLVSAGADVNATNQSGLTPLHEAARWNWNIEVVKFLVSKGANVYARDNTGKTPLDYAKERERNHAIVEYLSNIK